MAYSYVNGHREGVVFLFYRDGRILIEHRPAGQAEEVFFTNGSIEDIDHTLGRDYREVALLREINEELQGKVEPLKYHYLGDILAESINVLFYIYVITEWSGKIPDYTVEEGKIFSKLSWIPLEQYKKFLIYESAHEMCERLIRFLEARSETEE
jgi:8-oxo-dGTP pyrophosphatase MutT (NUDIX family)